MQETYTWASGHLPHYTKPGSAPSVKSHYPEWALSQIPYQRQQKTYTTFLKLRNKKTEATFVSLHLDSTLSCFTCRTHQPCKFYYIQPTSKWVKFRVTEGGKYPQSSSKREYTKAGRNYKQGYFSKETFEKNMEKIHFDLSLVMKKHSILKIWISS